MPYWSLRELRFYVGMETLRYLKDQGFPWDYMRRLNEKDLVTLRGIAEEEMDEQDQ